MKSLPAGTAFQSSSRIVPAEMFHASFRGVNASFAVAYLRTLARCKSHGANPSEIYRHYGGVAVCRLVKNPRKFLLTGIQEYRILHLVDSYCEDGPRLDLGEILQGCADAQLLGSDTQDSQVHRTSRFGRSRGIIRPREGELK